MTYASAPSASRIPIQKGEEHVFGHVIGNKTRVGKDRSSFKACATDGLGRFVSSIRVHLQIVDITDHLSDLNDVIWHFKTGPT